MVVSSISLHRAVAANLQQPFLWLSSPCHRHTIPQPVDGWHRCLLCSLEYKIEA